MANKNMVLVGILISAVFIIVGVYLILNPLSQGGGNGGAPGGNDSSYIEQTASTTHSVMPEYKVTEEDLNQNANVPLTVGKKYEYKTTQQMTMQMLMCNGQPARGGGKGGGGPGNENQNQVNSTTELPAGCEYVNRTSTQITDTVFYVEKIEKVENKDCYKVSTSTTREISAEERNMTSRLSAQQQQRFQNMRQNQQQNTTYYYDKETGKITEVIIKTGITELTFTGDLANAMLNMGRTFTRNLMNATQINATRNRNMGGGTSLDVPVFSQWMLALNENFMWSQVVDEQTGGYKVEMTYKVTCVEKINNRDIFKVEITLLENNKINTKWIVWIDKEKRILVKMQRITRGITGAETNLVSEM
ncbi:exported hypothetical protein [groundwater metagenome]|uniref:Uncharacterized protein n=1 Tax=groundwater metagenome TaxID=717931 RepID=A0A098E792_9ZZZZ